MTWADGGVIAASVVVMEVFAWATHRYLMHGALWGWHRSHHEPHDTLLEKNDLFGLIFGGVSAAVVAWGMAVGGIVLDIGLGLVVYGLAYYVLHDGLVHQRWPFRVSPRTGYLGRLVQAHHLHHAAKGRDGSVSFGFLYAPPMRRLMERYQAQKPRRTGASAS